MIAVRQMGPANAATKHIREALPKLRDDVTMLRRAGLHDAADQLEAALDDLTGLASALDNEARSTFAAIRAGREVPK